MLLKPLPYPSADRIVSLEVTPRGEPRSVVPPQLSRLARVRPASRRWRRPSPADVALTGVGERRIRLARVTPTIFDVFARRWRSAAGFGRRKPFQAVSDRDPAHGFTAHQLGAATDRRQDVVVDARVLIVGVLPAVDFCCTAPTSSSLRFTDSDYVERRSAEFLRDRPAARRVSRRRERGDRTIVTSLTQQFPDLTKWGARVAALRDDEFTRARPLLLMVLGVASLLLITGASLASLQLVGPAGGEANSIRAAVGAGRPDDPPTDCRGGDAVRTGRRPAVGLAASCCRSSSPPLPQTFRI